MTILLYQSPFGSQIYGTAIEGSDIDIGRVILEPKSKLFGIQDAESIEQSIKDGEDVREVYLRRFIRLCVAGNPNVLEWLFTPTHLTEGLPIFYHNIIGNRSLFIVKDRIIRSHLGFAKSQIIKMRNHEREMGAKRKLLYEKFGYDTKYASHAIRLLFQLRQLLTEGIIEYPYPKDLIENVLLPIKKGEVALNEFDRLYEEELRITESLIDGPKRNALFGAKTPDYLKIAFLLESTYHKLYYNQDLGDNRNV
jgi:predicted nucleotidyltransferase